METLATVIDGKRKQARSLKEIERRRRALLRSLDGIREPRETVESMVEMGDLYRDEARLVLVGEFDQEERLVLRTSPAWLQLEAALEWYRRAREAGPGVAEGLDRGRLALVEAVTLTRLGRSREAFAAYANIVRSYRRTRYADFALGDHHVRTGNEVKGRRAYGVVAGSRDRDLDVYARFRLAHLDALAGDEESATEGLEKLVGEAPGSPLQAMVRRGVLTALAVHRAEELSLTELVDWMEERCRSEHPSCVRELRAASADQLEEVARDRAASWLRNVDRLSFLVGRFETRRQVATYGRAMQMRGGSSRRSPRPATAKTAGLPLRSGFELL